MRSIKMQTIDVNQAKQHLSELIEQTIGGDEVIITKDGKPIAKLVAVTRANKQRNFGSAKDLIKISDDFDEPVDNFKEYM